MEEKKKKKLHRDQQRCNNANAAVKGCLYSEINNQCLDILLEDQANSNTNKQLTKTQINKLLQIAKKTNIKSKTLLVKSQSSIAQEVYKRYAKTQFNQIKSMNKRNETIGDVEGISEFIINDEILEMSSNVILVGNQSGKIIYAYIYIYSFHHFGNTTMCV